ncbi:hypothetical protein BC834DRAFT_189056 [Gloeopeniophorella convolvens]|nr:hypothetical protein BC834DRAFT_189056 [Gloeopeniophorella convolvens]
MTQDGIGLTSNLSPPPPRPRDIKPENFIVTDAWPLNADGIRERKVVVKLSNFGLSTRDAVSSDMDCGSAPYMSFECRNNVAPVYKPRAADVWSLGIVLINMLYHYNPWTDTATGGCPSFDLYLRNPTEFFMHRFAGMTLPVANSLVENVFCILDDPTDDSQRIGAPRIWPLGARPARALGSAPVGGHPYALARIVHGVGCRSLSPRLGSALEASVVSSSLRRRRIAPSSVCRAPLPRARGNPHSATPTQLRTARPSSHHHSCRRRTAPLSSRRAPSRAVTSAHFIPRRTTTRVVSRPRPRLHQHASKYRRAVARRTQASSRHPTRLITRNNELQPRPR